MDAVKKDEFSTNNLFKLLVNFVYETLLDQFINNNGECKYSTFSLINWNVLIDDKNEGIKKNKKKKHFFLKLL